MSGAARFTGRVALVTGAASGIGRATALRLASEGARVACADFDEAGAKAATEEIASAGGDAFPLALDVRDAAGCQAAVDECVARAGRIDVLCNVAGIGIYGHAAELDPADWTRVIEVNLSGTFYACRAALPHLLASGGNIVNMASAAGLSGVAYAAAYCASKGGVVMLTKSLAVEYVGRVRVNCVCPGGVDTPLTRGIAFPKDVDPRLMARMQLMPRIARAEEIAGAVAYLASDEAGYVTGTAFEIDGGQTA